MLAEGLYIDKHVVSPGKDADDAQQDEPLAMRHADGSCTMEWAIPLNSGDKNDIQVKPGGKLRMNLAYIDGFRDTEEHRHGARPARRIGPCGRVERRATHGQRVRRRGRRFEGRPVIALKRRRRARPAAPRERGSILTGNPAVAKAAIEYRYAGIDGQSKTAFGKVYLPAVAADGKTKVPLFYSAGYELDDGGALGQGDVAGPLPHPPG